MDIHWLGHSAIRLRPAGSTTVLLMDPYGPNLNIKPAERFSAEPDIATFSNPGPNHSSRDLLARNTQIIDTAGEYELKGIMIRAAMTPLAPDQPRRERNVAYSVRTDGITVCHLGNIRSPLTGSQADVLGPVDIVIVPVPAEDGPTIPARQIVRAAQQLEAKIMIPVHAGTDDQMEAFLKEAGAKNNAEPVPRLNPTRNNLPDALEIRRLQPQASSRKR